MSVSDALKYDFDYKNEILSGCFDEVNPFTVEVRTLVALVMR